MKIVVSLLVVLVFLPAVLGQCQPKKYPKECSENYVIQKVQDENCSIFVRVLEFCPYGCFEGNCLAQSGVPTISIEPKFSLKPCEESSISFNLTNSGPTMSNIQLSVKGLAASWFSLPAMVTLASNETKVISVPVRVPCDAKGKYIFTVIASASTTAFAPSLVEVGERLMITTTIRTISPLVGLALILLILFLLTWFKHGKQEEEQFSSKARL